TSSWTEIGLAEQSATDAPPASSVHIRLAVSGVTCRHAAIPSDASGRSAAKRSRTCLRTGICSVAQAIRSAPAGARLRSATSCGGSAARANSTLVPVVVGLIGTLDRQSQVSRLRVGQLRQLGAERVEMQPRDLLVEMLGQRVDPLLVEVGVPVQLDLRDHL